MSIQYFLTFFIGIAIYISGVIGAGDIKYATVLSLSLPMDLLPSALLLTMLTGGILASFYLMLNLVRRIRSQMYGGVDKTQYNTGIPYGVAISVGFYLMIVSHYL
ncbi:type IV prepilin peptidase tadV/cpaA [Vibrio ishigakensis]|uniref:Type IV prepilin peptidase tadV/cpaA n=1 Tax=Vibrio ishigakensis TaxID=1481914 RepID=A0A0B8P245_9VIBR|nr:type IV prepilin peptidase tadV/cpaA [Vibrio ishigakensis]